MTLYSGNAHVYGDHLDTNKMVYEPFEAWHIAHLTARIFEEVDKTFKERVRIGDFLIAGENLGSGEHSTLVALALRNSGILVILARSFAPGFEDAARRTGMIVGIIGDHRTEMGDAVTLDTERGVLINGVTRHEAQVTLL